jgi:hypothetical protein
LVRDLGHVELSWWFAEGDEPKSKKAATLGLRPSRKRC